MGHATRQDRCCSAWQVHPAPIIEIDLCKIEKNKIVDLSSGDGLTGKAKKWSIKDSEILIRGNIPAGSYRIL